MHLSAGNYSVGLEFERCLSVCVCVCTGMGIFANTGKKFVSVMVSFSKSLQQESDPCMLYLCVCCE